MIALGLKGVYLPIPQWVGVYITGVTTPTYKGNHCGSFLREFKSYERGGTDKLISPCYPSFASPATPLVSLHCKLSHSLGHPSDRCWTTSRLRSLRRSWSRGRTLTRSPRRSSIMRIRTVMATSPTKSSQDQNMMSSELPHLPALPPPLPCCHALLSVVPEEFQQF